MSRRPDRRTLLGRAAAVVLAALVVPAGCGGDDEPGSTERPLTDAEAAMLANVLFADLDAGGAEFTVAVQVGTGATINLQGEIDWTTHRGYAQVSARGVETGVREVYWSDDAVLEARDDLAPLLERAGLAATPWVVRDPDPVGRQLDQVLAVVTGLAATQRDNPLLVAQEPGSAYLRDDTVRGIDAVVLRWGTRGTFWLDADDGRLLRFEGDNATRTRPVVVDLVAVRSVTIDGPPAELVTDVADIDDVYAAALAT